MAVSKSLTFDIFGRDKSASKTMSTVGRNAEKMGDRLHKVGVGIGLGLAAAGAGAVAFSIDSVKAFAEAEKSQLKLQDAFDRFPKLADTNMERLGELNSQLAKKTKFDDDATAAAQANLAQYKLTGKQVEKLTPLMQDYAAKTGKELPDAAKILGKAMLGQGRALKDIGVDFKDTGSLAGNFESVVDSLTAKVGGFAEKEGLTASGRLEIIGNRFGEIQEKVGAAFLPALDSAADGLEQEFLPAAEGVADWLATTGIPKLIEYSDTYGDDVLPALQEVADWVVLTGIPMLGDFSTAFGDVQQASYDFGYNMADNLKPAYDALYNFGEDIEPIISAWSNFWQDVGYNAAEYVQKGQPGTTPSLPKAPATIAPPKQGVPKKASSTKKVPGLATGGTAMSRGLALIGERGPELLHLPKGASVIPLDRSRSGGDGGPRVALTINPAPGMSEETIGRVAANYVNQGMRRYA